MKKINLHDGHLGSFTTVNARQKTVMTIRFEIISNCNHLPLT